MAYKTCCFGTHKKHFFAHKPSAATVKTLLKLFIEISETTTQILLLIMFARKYTVCVCVPTCVSVCKLQLFIVGANVVRLHPKRSPIIMEFRKQKLNPNSLKQR